MGFHCSDCVYSSFVFQEETRTYQGACSRGYTLTDPRVHQSPKNRFVVRPDQLVPTIDPFGNEYLRTSNVCHQFLRPQDASPRAR